MRSSYWDPDVARERDRERERLERERERERWRRQLASETRLESLFVLATVLQSLMAGIAIGLMLG
jgi:hypothetical protein